MLKDLILRVIRRYFPELHAKLHLPILAVVINIPDTPAGDCTESRPRYAVNVRIIDHNFKIVEDKPIIRDVPVALGAAGQGRGLAALPLPGTIVEIAFAYGLPSKPYVRLALPYNLALPENDATSIKLQQTPDNYIQLTDNNEINIVTKTANIKANDQINAEAMLFISLIAPQLYIGSKEISLLQTLIELQTHLTTALTALQSHNHAPASESWRDVISTATSGIESTQARVTAIKK